MRFWGWVTSWFRRKPRPARVVAEIRQGRLTGRVAVTGGTGYTSQPVNLSQVPGRAFTPRTEVSRFTRPTNWDDVPLDNRTAVLIDQDTSDALVFALAQQAQMADLAARQAAYQAVEQSVVYQIPRREEPERFAGWTSQEVEAPRQAPEPDYGASCQAFDQSTGQDSSWSSGSDSSSSYDQGSSSDSGSSSSGD